VIIGESAVRDRLRTAGAPLSSAFYDRDTLLVARDLLGAVMTCRTDEGTASGIIVETEAYLGVEDAACHAVAGRTTRTWHLFGPPGTAYVYRIYGMHWCVNAVTMPEGIGSAVLIRALAPLDGLTLMRQRRPRASRDRDLTNGPGKLCAALGIDERHDGVSLSLSSLRICAGVAVDDTQVVMTPRIGITRAAALPYRYFIDGEPNVSATPKAFERRPYRA
jgi:DNA-3-methyladenine glycosylase